MGDLATELREGFLVADEPVAWGTTLAAVVERFGLELGTDGRWTAAPASRFGALAVRGAALHAPSPDRPVLRARHAVDGGACLHEDAGLDAALAALTPALGSPVREDHALLPHGAPASQVRATLRWTLGEVELTLSAFFAVRAAGDGEESGGLFLAHAEAPLAAPYLPAFHGRGAPWVDDPGAEGRVARFEVPGLRELGGFPHRDGDALLAHAALYHPHLRATPTWVAPRIAGDAAALWEHPSGAWGIATARLTFVVEPDAAPAFRHVRTLPAKGPGGASLETRDGGFVLTADGAPDALDALVAALRERGAELEVLEWADC